MCDGIHHGEVEELVSVERWSHYRGVTTHTTDEAHHGNR